MGKATLDKPGNRDLVLSQIRRQHGLEVGVWELVGIVRSTYQEYKSKHPDFAAEVEKIREEFEKPRRPCDNVKLQERANELLERYIEGGCKTKRWQRFMKAIPKKDKDGHPILDATGQQAYDYIITRVIETIYDNGINLKAYEKIFPEDYYSEKSLKFIVASQFQHIQENITDQEKQQVIIEWLKQFKDDFYLEMAAITGYTPKPKTKKQSFFS
jgi:hypothetical protein